MFCQYCDKSAKSKRSKQQHELRCKSNPDKLIVKPSYGMLGKKGANQFTYGATVSDSTKQKLSESTRKLNEIRWADSDFRAKHSAAMKRAVELNPESYTSSNRGRVKQIIYDGIKFHGQWEVDFYKWAKSKNIDITRPIHGFKYNWNGERTYFPDFYIRSMDMYVEVKGYETERDNAKWDQFPKKLCVIKHNEIKAIQAGKFEKVDLHLTIKNK